MKIIIMASRSFMPHSYLARPPFTRSSSASSVKSEDSIISSLKSLSVEYMEEKRAKGKENCRSNTSSPGMYNARIGPIRSGIHHKTGAAPSPPPHTTDSTFHTSYCRQRPLQVANCFGNLGHNTSTSQSRLEEATTPGRKRSDPIAIQLPGRDTRAVYTPLSARGDLPG